ncbi:hypothetical protein [Neorhodopirellula pilleata]|uniref:Tetratricopeptide repeat protein n=1 Tax=Neorhodopirellula pilleata TaxID=2714738 RepID=A0A5C6A8R3_9BACT|nr:hypothetical protein [Neorhodopirellula pilleata]TWT95698.1 hypothetical protein Pla100_33400 [Neorhodopirellula pilleata]
MIRISNLILLFVVVSCLGCQSGSPDPPKLDSTLARSSEAGRIAYAEGDVDAAIAEYRDAIHRAWLMDDPYEAGTNAYNLAACLITIGDDERAQDWLIDARAELTRANSSVAYTWLLQAKIAQEAGHWTEALSMIDRAACSPPPCDSDDSGCCCNGNDACDDRCVYQIPCVGDKFRKKDEIAECEDDFRAQVHLAKARVAAELGDIPTALCHYAKACEIAKEVCSEDLQAELQNVAAMIHLAKEEYLQAAWHFDKEAKHSRLAKNYRVISGALELAAAAYSEAGQYQLAADRLSRVARIWFGRGDMDRAWKHLNHASELVNRAGCDATSIRLSLLADEIQQVVGGDLSLDDSLNNESLIEQPLACRRVD